MTASLAKKPLPIFLRALPVLLAALLLFAAQIAFSQLGVRIAGLFSYRRIDPSNAFAWISVHHIVQGAAILIVMALISLLFRSDFRLGLGDKRLGIRIVLWFTAIIAVYQFAMWFLLNALSLFKPFAYPVNTRNVLGTMAFQLFLSGTCEELLFRAFPITLLSMLTSKTFRLLKTQVSVPLSVIIAAVMFSLAHINWTVNPFRLQYDILQLLYALAMGIIQGWAYVKTRSVVYPMMMHGISNVLVTSISIVMPILF
jgi:membrane protease YdiL (CAAX protease family)